MTTMTDDADENSVSGQLDFFDAPPVIPVSRLDADQYSADDIDGVTESIFGSGNVAYASLQASQVDLAMSLNEAASPESGQVPDERHSLPVSGQAVLPEQSGATGLALHGGAERMLPTDTDRAIGDSDAQGASDLGAEGNFSHATVGALGASTLSSDVGAFSPASNLSLGGNSNFESGMTVSTVINNTTQNTVNNTTNIVNVGDTIGDTIETVVNLGDETIENITNLGDQTIENVTNLVGDVIENVLNGDVTEIINTVGDTVNTQIDTVTTFLGDEITTVTETVTNILEDTGVTEVVNDIAETVNTTVDAVFDLLPDTGGLGIHLDTGLLDTLETGLDVSIVDSIAVGLNTGMVSGNLTALAGDLTGIDTSLATVDTGLIAGFDLLGGVDPVDGADISIAGADLPDISLDPVEELIGDIDIDVAAPDITDDPLSLLDVVQEVVEDIGSLDPADVDGVLDSLGDQGLDGALDIVAGDTELAQDFDTDVNDLIEDLSGGDTPVIDEAVDLLSLDGGGDGGGVLDGLGDADWTESTIDAGGGLFDDFVDGLGGGEADALPDPSGTVAEGIGVLDVDPSLDAGSLGGLFG